MDEMGHHDGGPANNIHPPHPHMKNRLTAAVCLPEDDQHAVLIGRVWSPEFSGPTLVLVRRHGVYDLSRVAATSSQIFNLSNPVASIREAGPLPRLATLNDVLENSAWDARDLGTPWFLPPCDLQPIKASGVTFVDSLLEQSSRNRQEAIPQKPTRSAGTSLRSLAITCPE